MDTTEKQRILEDAFNTLCSIGVVRNKTEFADYIGINRSGLSAAMNGNEKYLTDSLISKVIAAVNRPKVNISHSPHTNVATGQSCITVNGSRDIDDQTEMADELVPVIPRRLYKETEVNIVDYLEENEDSVQWSPEVKQFPKTTCFYTVDTMAMYPHFHQGDILALKAISRSAPIVNGEVYALDTRELGIIVRFAYDRGDKVELRNAENATRFEAFSVMKEDIFTIFRVVGLMRTNI